MTTQELLSRVMKLWSPPAFYVLTEVRNMTGYGSREGYADVLAMSVWPSRGIELIGAELKVSRSDWLRELKDPAKADKFFRFCHRWYLITGPDVAQESEIPAAWGWMVAGPKGLKVVKAAPELKPELPEWRFLASIFRNVGAKAQGMVSESEVEMLALKKANEMRERDKGSWEVEHKAHVQTQEQLQKLRNAVTAFNNATGIGLETWFDGPKEQEYRTKGLLFHAFMQGGHNRVLSEMEETVKHLSQLQTYLQRELESYKTRRNSLSQHLAETPTSGAKEVECAV